MDLFAFIHAPDPTKVKIVERERVGDEPLLLQTIVGRTVPLLPVVPDRADSELEISIDKLFDEGGSGSQAVQGGSAGVGEGINIQPLTEVTDVVTKDMSPLGDPIPTLPFVTSSVSVTPEREGEDHTDSVFCSSDDSCYYHPLMADPDVIVKEKITKPSVFSADSSSTGGADPNAGIFLILPKVTFLSRLDDGRICREMIDEFAPSKFFASVRRIEHDQLLTEFNVGATRQMSLSVKVRMRTEYNIREKRRLKSAVDEKDELLKARDKDIENLKTHMVLKEAEAAKAIRLRDEASNFVTIEKSLWDEVNALNGRNIILEKERNALDVKVADLEASMVSKECERTDLHAQLTFVKSHNDSLADQVHELEVASFVLQEKLSSYENLTERLEEFQDAQLKVVNDKFDKLYADFVEMALHLKERFYPHLLTTISGRRWLLTHGMELAISKCLKSFEYLSALGATIGKVIEKDMQDGLSAGITHGMKGRALTDVSTYNPSAEADYIFALQHETLAERLGLTELHPHVDQLMVWKIKENIAGQRSALRDVFFPLFEPFSAEVLTGAGGTSDTVPATAVATTALSKTLASTSTVAPISVDDYVVVGTDDQAGADGNADPFPNVDDAELNIL
nr:hypothetical protein [Tanacetum cinerariifolium]